MEREENKICVYNRRRLLIKKITYWLFITISRNVEVFINKKKKAM